MPKDPIRGVSSSVYPQASEVRGRDKAKKTGKDRQHRTVEESFVPNRLPSRPSATTLSSPRPSVLRIISKVKEGRFGRLMTAGHKRKPKIIPAINNRKPFNEFWEVVDTGKDFSDTVQHRIMRVKAPHRTKKSMLGEWHVKSPGQESSAERFKRFMQKIIYRITGQPWKAYFYNDRQLLAQKEVLAGNVYKITMMAGDPPGGDFDDIYRVHYSYDADTESHCIASRDLEGYKPGSQLFAKASTTPTFVDYDSNLNPVTDLVIRRFLLGDEDYLKLDNYMYKPGADGASAEMCNIDFGMAFYNMFPMKPPCSEQQFKQKLFQPSAKHRLQYWRKNTMLSVIRQMDSEAVDAGIRKGLSKIALLSDGQLNDVVGHVHQKDVREALLTILRFKRDQARAILGKGDWPEELGRRVSDSLVGRFRRT